MDHIPWPIPRSGPLLGPIGNGQAGDFPLAGSAFAWFDEVDFWETSRQNWVEGLCAFELVPESQALLSAPRPDLLGLRLDRPRIMGIVNVTPDSFSDGGDRAGPVQAVADAVQMVADGADILDVGGESTRPGARAISVTEETDRVVPVIEGIRSAGVTAPISIDTRKAAVAQAALVAGAGMINDVSAMNYDHNMASVAARRSVPICLMHAQGDPATMQQNPRYNHVLIDIFRYLEKRITQAEAAGIKRANMVVDPGIGFGKTLDHNMEILKRLSLFHALGVPLLLGASRKGFIGAIGKAPLPKDRTPGSVAVALHAASQGAHIIRVHDVAETRQALNLWQSINDREGVFHGG